MVTNGESKPIFRDELPPVTTQFALSERATREEIGASVEAVCGHPTLRLPVSRDTVSGPWRPPKIQSCSISPEAASP